MSMPQKSQKQVGVRQTQQSRKEYHTGTQTQSGHSVLAQMALHLLSGPGRFTV